MYKVFAIWIAPKDIDGFERHYLGTHVPLATAIPGLRRLVLTKAERSLDGGPPAFHRISELWFDDVGAFEAARQSPEVEAASRDVAEMQARFGVEPIVLTGASEDIAGLFA